MHVSGACNCFPWPPDDDDVPLKLCGRCCCAALMGAGAAWREEWLEKLLYEQTGEPCIQRRARKYETRGLLYPFPSPAEPPLKQSAVELLPTIP